LFEKSIICLELAVIKNSKNFWELTSFELEAFTKTFNQITLETTTNNNQGVFMKPRETQINFFLSFLFEIDSCFLESKAW
jgi:hypothetical protein